MSGKYPICSIIGISILLFTGLLFSAEEGAYSKKTPVNGRVAKNSAQAQTREREVVAEDTIIKNKNRTKEIPYPKVTFITKSTSQKEEISKRRLMVNGFELSDFGKSNLEGLRSKALADFYYRKDNYSKAIKFYEDASRNIPDEADIYYNLANIYAIENVYSMANSYYKIAAEKYSLPENFGKSQRNYYLSMIRYSFFLEKDERNYSGNHKTALENFTKLLKSMDEIKENYPDVLIELEKLRKLLYGDTTVIQMK